jgi:hypothetical protein
MPSGLFNTPSHRNSASLRRRLRGVPGEARAFSFGGGAPHETAFEMKNLRFEKNFSESTTWDFQ